MILHSAIQNHSMQCRLIKYLSTEFEMFHINQANSTIRVLTLPNNPFFILRCVKGPYSGDLNHVFYISFKGQRLSVVVMLNAEKSVDNRN